MTRPLQLHLSLDEIDALLADSAGASTREHVGACAFCAACCQSIMTSSETAPGSTV